MLCYLCRQCAQGLQMGAVRVKAKQCASCWHPARVATPVPQRLRRAHLQAKRRLPRSSGVAGRAALIDPAMLMLHRNRCADHGHVTGVLTHRLASAL